MNDDPTSLANLHDIVLPAPLPLWPPAPGWLWLLGMLAVVLVMALLRALIRRQRNHYRREALAELQRLETVGLQATEYGPQQQALARVSVLLKRTALTAYPRAEVAELTGSKWFAFLDEHGGTRFSGGLGEALEQAAYHSARPAWESAQLTRLFSETRQWIRQHRPVREDTVGETSAS